MGEKHAKFGTISDIQSLAVNTSRIDEDIQNQTSIRSTAISPALGDKS